MTTHDPSIDTTYGDPKGGVTAFVSIVGIIMFVLTVIYLEALYYSSEKRQNELKVVEQPASAVEKNRADQRARLAAYDYDHAFVNADGQPGRVTIPIDDAKTRLLREWGAGESTD
jgi:uncharacterized protein YxeA